MKPISKKKRANFCENKLFNINKDGGACQEGKKGLTSESICIPSTGHSLIEDKGQNDS